MSVISGDFGSGEGEDGTATASVGVCVVVVGVVCDAGDEGVGFAEVLGVGTVLVAVGVA